MDQRVIKTKASLTKALFKLFEIKRSKKLQLQLQNYVGLLISTGALFMFIIQCE
ncbi:hypothetical protein Lacidipiscis_01631 [Ligilactobacillus acidipiscis]|nr:hypothetical protein Lacidipiscis_01631 [Ligilactobacillus acidipiscis]GEN21826.1 hypothetical protein LAC02_51070 [Ligilactobacillus acidipiscis]